MSSEHTQNSGYALAEISLAANRLCESREIGRDPINTIAHVADTFRMRALLSERLEFAAQEAYRLRIQIESVKSLEDIPKLIATARQHHADLRFSASLT